jgi:hypothetical protein
MIASLFAILLASAQPAPAEEPVVTDAEVQTEVQAEAEAPVAPPAPEPELQATAAATPVQQPEEEIVCRRRLVPSERIGQRHRVVRDCRPASEWPARNSGRRGGD